MMLARPRLAVAVRRAAGLAMVVLLSGVALAPVAVADPVRTAPRSYSIVVLTARSGAAFVPSGIGNPVNKHSRVAGHTVVGALSRAAVFDLRTRSLRVLTAFPGRSTYANDINADGVVVGENRDAAGHRQAFAWSTRSGAVRLLTGPGATQSWANAINDRGVAVGGIVTPTRSLGIVWTAHGSRSLTLDLDEAVGINTRGAVIGRRLDVGAGTDNRALIWKPWTGRLDDLSPLADDDGAQPMDINDAGFVVGQSYSVERDDLVLRPVLWSPRKVLPCRLSAAEGNNVAAALNAHNQVAGLEVTFVGNTHRSVVWQGCRGPVLTLPSDSSVYALPSGINDRGQVVGSTGAVGLAWFRGHPA